MAPDKEQLVIKIRQDHEYMLELMHRIRALCSHDGPIENCSGCSSSKQSICQDTIEHLIRTFVDVTLRHNLIESACMSDCVPDAHRIAHNWAHVAMAAQLKAIRVEFHQDGNGVAAMHGIALALDTLTRHLDEFDRPLESYLLAA